MSMINDTERWERMLKVGYSIENIINGLKYIGNEINIETPLWETFCKRIDTIDNNVDKLIELIEIRKQNK